MAARRLTDEDQLRPSGAVAVGDLMPSGVCRVLAVVDEEAEAFEGIIGAFQVVPLVLLKSLPALQPQMLFFCVVVRVVVLVVNQGCSDLIGCIKTMIIISMMITIKMIIDEINQ